MSGLRWTRRTTEKIAEQLLGLGICVSAIARILNPACNIKRGTVPEETVSS